MAKLKVPSLQHLAHNWRETPEGVSKKLVSVAVHPPQFSYEPLFMPTEDATNHRCSGISCIHAA